MRNVYQDICQHNLTRAVLLVRGARYEESFITEECSYSLTLYREIWPSDVFGTDTVTSNEELNIIEQLLFNPLSGTIPNYNNVYFIAFN